MARVASFPEKVVVMPFSPILRMDRKHPPMLGEWSTFVSSIVLFSPFMRVVVEIVPNPM
jgi:hypothetical protein